ncbi:MAG: hypothetical protein Kow0026_00090 [Oricola sp.]
MVEVQALGAGGGSIAGVRDGKLFVGPRSAGAMPGPACFALGGDEPTVTDANLVLNRIDPDNFLGGARKLDLEKARDAIRKRLAEPLNLSVEAAALAVIEAVDADVGAEIGRLRSEAQSVDPLMIVYGGAGPLHACRVAEGAGLRRIAITPFSAVFSAFSSSLMDVGHNYLRTVNVPVSELAASDGAAKALTEIHAAALRDMRGEGFEVSDLLWQLEAIVADDDGTEGRVALGVVDPLLEASLADFSRCISDSQPGAVRITAIGLFVSARVPHFTFEKSDETGSDVGVARTGTRNAVVGTANAPEPVPVFDLARLEPGHVLAGPAILESRQTTVWVAPGWRARIDRYQNLMMSRG